MKKKTNHGLFPLRLGKPFILRGGVAAAPPKVNIVLGAAVPGCCCGCCEGLGAAPNWKGCVLGADGAAAVSGLAAPNTLVVAGKVKENDGEGL